MATVNTCLGPIDATKLGFTLSHEHIVNVALWRHLPMLYDKEATIQKAKDVLTAAKRGGVDSLIDLTTVDLGREVSIYKAASEASGLNVVVATGLWRDIPRFFWTREPDYIARFMIYEIEHGIDDSGIRPGVIKMAQDVEHVQDDGQLIDRAVRALRAAAKTAKETGVPISTHQWAPLEVGRRQLDIFLDEGVPMHLVCIGHSADTTDVSYLEELLAAGCYLSMDRYPGAAGRPDWQTRNATVKQLVQRGWAPRLMLGHDYPPRAVLVGVDDPPEDEPVRYTFLKRVAIPALLADGVTQEQVRLMTVEAPMRFLTGQLPLAREG